MEPRLPYLPGIRWVVFDIYGTLLASAAGEIATDSDTKDTIPAFRRVLQWYMEYFSSFSLVCPNEKEFARAFFELIRKEHASRVSERIPQPEVDIRNIWRTLFKTMHMLPPIITGTETTSVIEEAALRFELAVNPVWPMPHANEIILRLRERSYNLGIISNAQFYTPLIIEVLFQQTPASLGFNVSTWSYIEGIAKPSITLFRIFMDNARAIDPDINETEVLYIGNDIRNDISPARQLGFRTALYAGDTRSLRLRRDDPKLAFVEPDIVLTDLEQLKHVLFPEGTDIVNKEKPRKGSLP